MGGKGKNKDRKKKKARKAAKKEDKKAEKKKAKKDRKRKKNNNRKANTARNSTSTSSSSMNATCINNAVTYMKQLKLAVKNFGKQYNRIITNAKQTSGKAGKDSEFAPYLIKLRETGGGNASNMSCNGEEPEKVREEGCWQEKWRQEGKEEWCKEEQKRRSKKKGEGKKKKKKKKKS